MDLQNTMQGTMTSPEAQVQAQQEEVARTLAAIAAMHQQDVGALGQAQQQYGQAAAAPSPDIDPLSAFIPTLLSNIGSVIAQNPDYQRQTQQDLGAKRKALLEARAENLQALRDNVIQRAAAARDTDPVMEAKLRTQVNQLDKAYEQILESQRQDFALERQNAGFKHAKEMEDLRYRREMALADVRAKGAASGVADFDPTKYVQTSKTGQPYVVMSTKIPNLKVRQAVGEWAREQGISVLNDRQDASMQALLGARMAVNRLIELSADIHTDEGPAAVLSGLRKSAATAMKAKGTEKIRAYQGAQKGFMSLIARALGEKGNIANWDIQRIMSLIPGLTEPKSNADELLQVQLQGALNDIELGILGKSEIEADTGDDPSADGATRDVKFEAHKPKRSGKRGGYR